MSLAGQRIVRTGIDLGTGSVKLVRGEGSPRLEEITHLGVEEWGPANVGDDAARAAAALRKLLARLGLRRGRLGRIAVAVSGEQASVREVAMPTLTRSELRKALPFEARRHLTLDVIASPVLDFQVLGPAPAAEQGKAEQIRVLLAAASGIQREFCLKALDRAGLEPEVIDLEPLSQLNALFATPPTEKAAERAIGLLDIGERHCSLHIGREDGPMMTRVIGPGVGPTGSAGEGPEYAASLASAARETMMFYRARYHEETATVYTAGGGALASGLTDGIAAALQVPVVRFDPFHDLSMRVKKGKGLLSSGARFVTACGLCRWWDSGDV